MESDGLVQLKQSQAGTEGWQQDQDRAHAVLPPGESPSWVPSSIPEGEDKIKGNRELL